MYLHVSLWWQSRERVKESVARQGAPWSLAMATSCHGHPLPRPPPATATSCPARGRQAGSPPCQRDELELTPAPNPPDPHKCLVPISAGHSTAVPMGCSSPWSWHLPAPHSQLELLLQQRFADLCVVLLTQGCPCPPHSQGQQSPPCPAEAPNNCPVINSPLCLTRGIKVLLLFKRKQL